MRKSDQSLKNLSIASIYRHTVQPFDFHYTHLYDPASSASGPFPGLFTPDDGELLICATIINPDLWTLLTSRRIASCIENNMVQHTLSGALQTQWGDFKGAAKHAYTRGLIRFSDNQVIPVFIETGRASMVMIYGVSTVLQLTG
jgi:hypothetical protein